MGQQNRQGAGPARAFGERMIVAVVQMRAQGRPAGVPHQQHGQGRNPFQPVFISGTGDKAQGGQWGLEETVANRSQAAPLAQRATMLAQHKQADEQPFGLGQVPPWSGGSSDHNAAFTAYRSHPSFAGSATKPRKSPAL